MRTTLQSIQLSENIQILSTEHLQHIKGGLLLYCEEKRRTILGVSYKTQTWKITNNGKLGLTVKM